MIQKPLSSNNINFLPRSGVPMWTLMPSGRTPALGMVVLRCLVETSLDQDLMLIESRHGTGGMTVH